MIALLAIWLSSRRLGRLAPRRLLAGQTIAESRASVPCPRSPWACRARVIELMLLIVALLPPLALMLVPLNEEIRAGALFASGATALAALLGLVRLRLRAGRTGSAVTVGRGNLMRLALPTRAQPGPQHANHRSGRLGHVPDCGGQRLPHRSRWATARDPKRQWRLLAGCRNPTTDYPNLNTPEGRNDLGFSAADESVLTGSTIVALRVNSGDDASCRNLYRPRQPRVLGVPLAFVDRDGFAWADEPRDQPNPWQLLNTKDESSPIPVILEKNTANYALDLWGGLGETFTITDGRGRPLRLRVAALLGDSIFQGEL